METRSAVSNPYTFTLDQNYTISANIESDGITFSCYFDSYPTLAQFATSTGDWISATNMGAHKTSFSGIDINSSGSFSWAVTVDYTNGDGSGAHILLNLIGSPYTVEAAPNGNSAYWNNNKTIGADWINRIRSNGGTVSFKFTYV